MKSTQARISGIIPGITRAGGSVSMESRPPEFSDDALAMAFTDAHGDDLRYVAMQNIWLSWDGFRWAADETLRAYDYARTICRAAAVDCNEDRVRKALASAATVAAVEKLARADRRHAARADQFDTDMWILNTPKGMIDLRSGEIAPPRREAYITKITAVGPGGDCPTWLNFIRRTTDGDQELERFIARMLGYCLTGETFEHVLFFLHGLGANGKTVLTKTAENILKDYARPAPMEVFVASKFERHSTDVAGLQGARLVTAAETDKGRPWAEARLKLLTGGDRVTARKMRRDNVDFAPQFKLVITGNHRPRLSSRDEAICRRMLCVPFRVAIPPAERDEKLPDRLRSEWPGILSWMIGGCLEWQQRGLVPPNAVVSATQQYLEAEDSFGNWVAENTERDPNSFTRTPDLYASWRDFAEAAREHVGSMKDFAEAVEARGFHHKHTKVGNGYVGIKLKGKA